MSTQKPHEIIAGSFSRHENGRLKTYNPGDVAMLTKREATKLGKQVVRTDKVVPPSDFEDDGDAQATTTDDLSTADNGATSAKRRA